MMTRELEESRETVTCAVCVELFEDARLLNCSHSFCLHCLIGCQAQASEGGLTEVHCPVCRQLTVPPLVDIPLLPQNVFANKVAELIRTNDRSVNEQANNDDTSNDNETDEQFFVGNFLPEIDGGGKSIWPLLTSVGCGIAVLIFGLLTIYSSSRMVVLSSMMLTAASLIHLVRLVRGGNRQHMQTYSCSSCRNMQTSPIRYKCGMCNDFSLCPACFADDDLSLRHHIFLKLKFPQRRQLPLGPVLKPPAFGLADTLDYDNSVHGRAYIHSADRLLRIDGVRCAYCNTMPIRGVRYKCGMCRNYDLCESCETHSHRIHDISHVFMVLKHKAEINFISEPLVRAQFY